jgi:hypothetical protein
MTIDCELARRCAVIKWLNIATIVCATGWVIGDWNKCFAQTARSEREAKITGPRGRTIDRRLEIDRGPGTLERHLQIQRPNVTLQRDFQLQGGGRGVGFGGGGFGGPMIVQRNVFVAPRPSSSWSFGFMAAPLITFPFWQPAPPPVVVAPPPVVVAPQPPTTVAQPSPLDPVALAAQRLQSHHASSRRDGAQTLGRLHDPRAVPPLVHALKYDSSKDVKIAAALALGEIGGRDVELVLERCIIYEKHQEVRDAAAQALRRLRSQPVSDASVISSEVPRLSSPSSGSRPALTRPSPRNSSVEPQLDGPGAGAEPSDTDRVPPPPPTPVKPS